MTSLHDGILLLLACSVDAKTNSINDNKFDGLSEALSRGHGCPVLFEEVNDAEDVSN